MFLPCLRWWGRSKILYDDLGWAWQLTLPGSVGHSPGCQVPKPPPALSCNFLLVLMEQLPLATPWQLDQAFLSPELSTVGPVCMGSSAIPPVPSAWLALVSSLYWPRVQPRFPSEPPLRTHLAAPWGWPPSSSICCSPFPGHCPCPGWVSIKLSTDNLHQLNPSPHSELSGVRTHLVCGEWELLSRLWGPKPHLGPLPSARGLWVLVSLLVLAGAEL